MPKFVNAAFKANSWTFKAKAKTIRLEAKAKAIEFGLEAKAWPQGYWYITAKITIHEES